MGKGEFWDIGAHRRRACGEVTEEGEAVLDEVRRAGHELIKEGMMSQKTLEAISRPLIPEDELRRIYNEAL